MTNRAIEAGEVWKVNGRKGPMTIRFVEPVEDYNADGFFRAEIVSGKARFMSESYRDAQRFDGLGTEGTLLDFRTTLTNLIERVPN